MNINELKELQPKIVDRFERILEQDKLNHAYLFTGNFASFDLAQKLAQSRFCQNKMGVWPCGECRSCRLIAEEDFSDVTVVRPQNQIIKTERIRELLKNFSQSGVEGNEQVFIICEAEKMHLNAANSLLKMIEEPQSEVYIFLLTSDENLILPTIKSRTQVFHFPKNEDYLVAKLEESGLLKDQAQLLATYSQTLEEAQNLQTSKFFFDVTQVCQRFVDLCLAKNDLAFLQVARLSSLADDKEKQDQIFRILEILFSQHIEKESGRTFLDRLFQSRKMWRANVSFQNALEYMVIQPAKRS
ncbi:DNA polymerase III subunit delta' [Streptococcus gordonii]|uniref:DNA-directed DNA polymerase III, delta'' chain n=1 Tax=Streptococcus gordonii (strain Challis / ATCC 35105 / BCRC 15272 / CH1 / DL1 / V288) TaxID=467705 RepID=A8AYF7_STRGC|nr:DNA polymerase III subunit delta' [Streptococcus gordonii]ABV10506.1 DNA-directed DNA polymerase III, delta'' chain [Streptococcus gordonii str. Challis substr. CH1]MBZ2138051.1 DNA polymerase III subunit delta' [Streptococcus gordonii]MCY7139424.1 DNA polymerase III subunit delta' [Streptococcus gordonii]QGS43862.1 DNA polymerase III subunit delta' [Streptococcus gordonii]VEE22237.1 DNA polymerase III subunit delta' [Streptococcus gordonii]